jgi:hypothetical protein
MRDGLTVYPELCQELIHGLAERLRSDLDALATLHRPTRGVQV